MSEPHCAQPPADPGVEATLAVIRRRFARHRVVGQILFGSYLAAGRSHGDIDCLVIVADDVERSEAFVADGVPYDLIVCGIERIERRLARNYVHGNHFFLDVLANGRLVHSESSALDGMVAAARVRHAAGPPPLTTSDVRQAAAGLRAILKTAKLDARDRIDADDGDDDRHVLAGLTVDMAVRESMRMVLRLNGKWVSSLAENVRAVRAMGGDVAAYWDAYAAAKRRHESARDAGIQLANLVLALARQRERETGSQSIEL